MSKHLGLDLGTNSFKLVEATGKDNQRLIRQVGIIANPVGQLITEDLQDQLKIAEAIKKLITESSSSLNKVKVGLPESQVYTRVLTMPVLSQAELASAINWEAEQYIPIPLSEVQIDYTVLFKPGQEAKDTNMKVLLVAAKKNIINQFVNLINETGLELIGLETTILGLTRALSFVKDPPTLIAHLGASSSDFCVTVGGNIIFTHSISIAGTSLTRNIEQALQLTTAQAEQFKRSYGLSKSHLEGKVRDALWPVFESIIAETRKVINSFESVNRGKKIQRMLLSGGTSLLPDLSPELSNALGVKEIIISDPFYGHQIDKKLVLPKEKPVYTIATGLAF